MVRYRRGLPQDLQYPCSLLESMRRCWSGAPELRPSAGALTAVCAAPECLALRDAAAARPAAAAAAAPLRLAGTAPIGPLELYTVSEENVFYCALWVGWDLWSQPKHFTNSMLFLRFIITPSEVICFLYASDLWVHPAPRTRNYYRVAIY